ncbi:MAG TPA: hypothetical protein VHG89_03895 [Verrucomicrobiae bacterium]|nr:hypothetical protein [Verrucomicrobiae bacterium]
MKNFFVKIVVALIGIFVTAVCFADDTSDITNKVFVKKDKDGNPTFRMETVYRGKTKIMMITSRPNKEGVMVVTSRSYLVGGDLAMTEADEKHDGTLQTIAVYHPGTNDMEIFTRQSDGSVKPVSTQILDAYKKQNAAMNEFWDKAFDTNMNEDKLPNLIRDAQKKIQDAELEKTNTVSK